jgi:hypothetical protein
VDDKNAIRLPGSQDRLAIFGCTGSGKTVGALWHLSHKNFETQPWMVYNPSQDSKFDAIDFARDVDLDFIPNKPGLYIANFFPSDKPKLEENLAKVLRKGNVGVYVDEGYLSGSSPSLFDIIIAGRKLSVPVIYLAQRPVEKQGAPIVTIGANSEFVQIYELPRESDWNNILEIIPERHWQRQIGTLETGMEFVERKYHSLYWDRDKRKITKLGPVPTVPEIIDRINSRLRKKRVRI